MTLSRNLKSSPLGGSMNAEIPKVRVHDDTWDAATKLARESGMSLSEWVRTLIEIRVHGWGIAYVGGVLKDRISLQRLADGKRLCQNARPSDCKFLAFNSWRTRLLPGMNAGVSAA